MDSNPQSEVGASAEPAPDSNSQPASIGNSSGGGQLAVVPADVFRWNWGAFFLNWIWGLGNNTYIAFLCFVPFVNLVMPFVLGARGNEWAWRNKRWQNVEQFHSVQAGWAVAGLALNSLAIVVAVSIAASMLIMVGSTLQSSQAYKIALSRTKQSPAVQAAIGTPIKPEWGFSGSFDESETVGKVDYRFPISGPKGRAEVHLMATKTNSEWTIKELEVDPADGPPIDLTTAQERRNNPDHALPQAPESGRSADPSI